MHLTSPNIRPISKASASFLTLFLLVITLSSLPARANTPGESESIHCTPKMDILFQKVFMQDPWLEIASREAWLLWMKKVKERDGSLYAQQETARKMTARCLRVGFGNDDAGNIGTTVTCEISAHPCIRLLRQRPQSVQ